MHYSLAFAIFCVSISVVLGVVPEQVRNTLFKSDVTACQNRFLLIEVPQHSILGAVLFNCVMTKLADFLTHNKALAYTFMPMTPSFGSHHQ